MGKPRKKVDAASIEQSIRQLHQYVDDAAIAPLLAVLEAMKETPDDEALVERLSEAFRGLGIAQGAVLTYAPYVGLILSDDPFEDAL